MAEYIHATVHDGSDVRKNHNIAQPLYAYCGNSEAIIVSAKLHEKDLYIGQMCSVTSSLWKEVAVPAPRVITEVNDFNSVRVATQSSHHVCELLAWVECFCEYTETLETFLFHPTSIAHTAIFMPYEVVSIWEGTR